MRVYCSIPISKQYPGFFWSQPQVLGYGAEDTDAINAGTFESSRHDELEARMIAAKAQLEAAEVPGAQDWMSRRRLIS